MLLLLSESKLVLESRSDMADESWSSSERVVDRVVFAWRLASKTRRNESPEWILSYISRPISVSLLAL